MGVSERRQRERAARRESILDAARDVLLSQGLRGTTTKEIAERCELSEATLFFYFQSKDEILLLLIFESISFWADEAVSLWIVATRLLREVDSPLWGRPTPMAPAGGLATGRYPLQR